MISTASLTLIEIVFSGYWHDCADKLKKFENKNMERTGNYSQFKDIFPFIVWKFPWWLHLFTKFVAGNYKKKDT